MEKIKLNNGTILEYNDIHENTNGLNITFTGVELEILRDAFDAISNLSTIEVLTENDVTCAIYVGYTNVDKYVIENETITITISKPNELEQRLYNLEETVLALL